MLVLLRLVSSRTYPLTAYILSNAVEGMGWRTEEASKPLPIAALRV